MNTLFRHIWTWLVVALGAVVVLVMAVGYLGAFTSPEDNIADFPMGIVNLDSGFSQAGMSLDEGKTIVASVQTSEGNGNGAIEWKTFETRDDLVRAIENNDVYGGVVIPENFSASLAAIAAPQLANGKPTAASVEILQNHGAGSIASSQAQIFADTLVASVNERASTMLQQQLGDTKTVPVDVAPLLSQPVSAKVTDVIPNVEHSGRGMAPFYAAVVVVVGGLLLANVISAGVDLITHREEGWGFLAIGSPVSARDALFAKVGLTMIAGVIGGALVTWLMQSALHIAVTSTWQLFMIATMGILLAGLLTLVFVGPLKTPGTLIALLLTTIFGVPSAGGVFPPEMLPSFYQAIGNILPVRFVYQSLRSIVFFGGSGSSGLQSGLIGMGIYLVVSIVLLIGIGRLMSGHTGTQDA